MTFSTDYSQITKEDIIKALPRGINITVSDEIVEMIQRSGDEIGILQEYVDENILNHISVLRGVKASFRDYVNAVKFCILKINMTNEEAWAKTFPDKYDRLIRDGKQVSNHVSMYNRSKLVHAIDANMLVATHVLYAPLHHAAIRKQYELMNGRAVDSIDDDGRIIYKGVSDQVQHLAAKTLAELTSQPEELNYNIKVGPSDEMKEIQSKTLKELNAIAERQKALLESGVPLEEVQKLNLTSTEPIDVDVEE